MGAKERILISIETSCDETAVAILRGGEELLANVVASQIDIHREYGGVVPEIAARQHLETINPLIEEALQAAGIGFADLDAVAVTVGPGLIIALLVGVSTAKAISYALSVPLVGVNHLESHIFASFLSDKGLEPPLIALLVSGGHTSIVLMDDYGRYNTLGSTLDDAAGEAFDKVAKLLELGYPGGPEIQKRADSGDGGRYKLPRPMIERQGYDFSFSGLKTAVVNLVRSEQKAGIEIDVNSLCASFQEAVFDVLLSKTAKALADNGLKRLVVTGGVASNSRLREVFSEYCKKKDVYLSIPPPDLCTDNAAMVAKAAWHKFENKQFIDFGHTVHAVLPLGK